LFLSKCLQDRTRAIDRAILQNKGHHAIDMLRCGMIFSG